eukprot:754449-Hanusia_phi.AAC.6
MGCAVRGSLTSRRRCKEKRSVMESRRHECWSDESGEAQERRPSGSKKAHRSRDIIKNKVEHAWYAPWYNIPQEPQGRGPHLY